MKIKVVSVEYEVIEKDELYLNNNECYGVIDYENLVIKIKSSLKTKRKTQTLWHELVHAIVDEMQIDFKEMEEEKIIDMLSKGIVCILSRNEDFDGEYKEIAI
jgi:Zn-dependent peptidase ImmA (M78 family)